MHHCCISGAADNKSGFMHMRNKHMQFIISLRNLILLPTPQPDSTHGLCDVSDYACYAINANASAALVNAIAWLTHLKSQQKFVHEVQQRHAQYLPQGSDLLHRSCPWWHVGVCRPGKNEEALVHDSHMHALRTIAGKTFKWSAHM